MRQRARVPLALAVLLLSTAACKKANDIQISKNPDAFDFGRSEVLRAVEEAARNPASPRAIAELKKTVDRLSDQFNESVEEEAERKLVFMALGPLAARFSDPIDEQMEELALTVWPIALHVEPHQGETPREYIARICQGELALECKNAVPEYWATILSAVVWRRLKERAREAYVRCGACQTETDKSHERALEKFRTHQTQIGAEAAMARRRAKPSQWPRSGPGAAPWNPELPVLELLGDGTAEFRGEQVDSAWRRMIRERREGAEILGLHLKPTADVRTLHSVLEDAREAGYRFVDLQVRDKEFPYTSRSYRLATGRFRGAERVAVKPVDSIQILVQALDIRARADQGDSARADQKDGASDRQRTVFAI